MLSWRTTGSFAIFYPPPINRSLRTSQTSLLVSSLLRLSLNSKITQSFFATPHTKFICIEFDLIFLRMRSAIITEGHPSQADQHVRGVLLLRVALSIICVKGWRITANSLAHICMVKLLSAEAIQQCDAESTQMLGGLVLMDGSYR